MKSNSSRREFIKTTIAVAAGTNLAGIVAAGASAVPTPPVTAGKIKKGVLMDMLPKQLSYADRLKMAKDLGFDNIQANTTPDQKEAEEIKKASEEAKMPIDSVMNMAHWDFPLSSADPAVVEKSLEGMRTSLHNAKLWGSYSVLLVPAVVNPQIPYHDAYIRSQKNIRKLLPLAEELKIVIALEEVWNKFLLSPLEFARYIDEFKSPYIKAWFDVGNVVLYGYPQDWIRTLGKRIVEVHLKDFKHGDGKYDWVNLGDGDVNWPEVRKAFAEIGFTGSATVELDGGDENYLRDVSHRVDRLLLGA